MDVILSSSGIEIVNGVTYIVSDNQNTIFKKDGNVITPIKINTTDNTDEVAKIDKKDFESLCYVNYKNSEYLLVVSSGSVKHTRDTLFIFDIEKQKVIHKKNIRDLYNNIQKEMGLNKNQLVNIEASTLNENNIIFFHRGNESGKNASISIPKNELLEYVLNNNKIPEFEVRKIELPIDKRFQGQALPGISGAYTLSKTKILITYSLEATQSNYHDGRILGSYIGILDLENGQVISTPIYENGNPTADRIIKAEGIILESELNDNFLQISVVSDNDNGDAEYLSLKIRLN